MERVSCIDIGTNTALLLIVDIDPKQGTIKPVHHKQAIVRLGQQVDELKIIDREAKERLINCLLEFKKISNDEGADTIIATGTSALRDAKNRMEVTSELVRSTGIVVRCISGEEEAELTFFGAVSGMENIPAPFTVTRHRRRKHGDFHGFNRWHYPKRQPRHRLRSADRTVFPLPPPAPRSTN